MSIELAEQHNIPADLRVQGMPWEGKSSKILRINLLSWQIIKILISLANFFCSFFPINLSGKNDFDKYI